MEYIKEGKYLLGYFAIVNLLFTSNASIKNRTK